MIDQLVRRGTDADVIELGYGTLTAGVVARPPVEEEKLAVIVSGAVTATLDGRSLGRAGARSDPFEGPGHAVYAPPGASLQLSADGDGAVVVIATAPAGPDAPGPGRIITPEDQRITEPGRDNFTRTVRTILGPEDRATRLLAGETLNPPGAWSSYPPHKHDTHRPPDEVKLEEVYLFRLDPPGGFGVQMLYEHDREELRERAFIVHDGDFAVIRSGYHPVVAAPGYGLYYFWVMAGEGRQMAPWFDPDHGWVK
jgi:5-deoxy-glucuronate isomerase